MRHSTHGASEHGGNAGPGTSGEGPAGSLPVRNELVLPRSAGNISYLEAGRGGKPVVFLHGFASSGEIDWARPGWLDAFSAAGFHVIAPDLRGHGRSAKPLDPEAYRFGAFVDDIVALSAVWGHGPAALVGYSMGGHLALSVALASPGLVDRIVVGGLGDDIIEMIGLAPEFADALDAGPSAADDDGAPARMRRFALARGNDPRVLAACLRGQASRFEFGRLRDIAAPTLIAAGENDRLAGRPDRMAATLPCCSTVRIAGASHASLPTKARFREAALSFVAGGSSAFDDGEVSPV